MRWAGHAVCKEEKKYPLGFWWEILRGKDYLEDSGVNGSIILKRICRKWDG
jgi:hypothetical protein